MSDVQLLPPNATAQERAMEAATGRIGSVPTPLRVLWDADACPAEFLPWLAWAYSVDEWDAAWTIAQQRESIKRSVNIHRRKGTIGAVVDALSALSVDARVQEWFNQIPPAEPYTFKLLINLDQVGVSQSALDRIIALVNNTKNLRSHLDLTEVTVTSRTGPVMAACANVGTEITVDNYELPQMVISEHVIAG